MSLCSLQKFILLPAYLFFHTLINTWYVLLSKNFIVLFFQFFNDPRSLYLSEILKCLNNPSENSWTCTFWRMQWFMYMIILDLSLIGMLQRLWFGHLTNACSDGDKLGWGAVQPLRHLLSLCRHPQNSISNVLGFLVQLSLEMFQWVWRSSVEGPWSIYHPEGGVPVYYISSSCLKPERRTMVDVSRRNNPGLAPAAMWGMSDWSFS